MQIIAIEHGEAESMDGVNWVLYVSHEDIISHTGMSEIRYGSWSEDDGLKLSMVRGTGTGQMIEQIGARLVAAVTEHCRRVPFALQDRFECWLMTADDRPLALIESACDENDRRVFESPQWHPGAAALEGAISAVGDARRLQQIINQRAGERARTCWLQREASAFGYSGDAITDDGGRIAAADMPTRMLQEEWHNETDRQLVADYLGWQAPWLLQLDSIGDDARQSIEQQAWCRPVLCAQQYRLFAKILDRQQLKVSRVKARLMGYDSKGQKVIETFIQTGDKETYSP